MIQDPINEISNKQKIKDQASYLNINKLNLLSQRMIELVTG